MAQVTGWGFAGLGGLALAFALFMAAQAFANGGDWAGLAILIVVMPVALLGATLAAIGGYILLAKNASQARQAINRGDVEAVRSTTPAAVAGLVFFFFPFIGIALSLYAYFAGKPGTTGRKLGLVAVFVNLAWFAAATLLF